MDTYKIGNKAKCIIRAYGAGMYGDQELQYDNQPYTILDNVEVGLNFANQNTTASSVRKTQLGFNVDFLNTVRISNVLLTDKILNLIYSKNEEKLCSHAENFNSNEEKQIFLTTSAEEIYQVFIYDEEGQLEQAYGTYNLADNNYALTVDKANASYLICYSFVGEKAVNLNRPNNIYLTLDFEIQSNINDTTSMMWLHIDKCMLSVEKNINFTYNTNTINLIGTVINDDTSNSYITVK